MPTTPIIDDIEKRVAQKSVGTERRFKPTPDDDACFKLWNMYIGQAQDYDKALLEGWKGDMDGMLLFSALYSASLTALIIESYKTLQEDPAETTAQLLKQLVLLSNGTVTTVGESPSFTLPISSLVCNSLWFLSLALALTCSLLATFVQQWTRDFLHKTTMRPSPVVQARVLAFSYFGLRRFGMHTFVDIIPILLHISLLFFFGGLVAFLLPINRPLTYLMACVLIIFILVYTCLSCIPLVYLDAPYRTPISSLLWRFGNNLHDFFLRRHNLPDNLSLTEAMLEMSLKNRSERDRHCMKYTMKSLNHDAELVPMFDAIPEAVLGSGDAVRFTNMNLVAPILLTPDPDENIVSRITTFITVSGQSADTARQEKDMQTSLKALWSLARLVIRCAPDVVSDTPVVWFDRNLKNVLKWSNSLPQSYLISALALIRTSRLQSLKQCIDTLAYKSSLIGVSVPVHEWLRIAKSYLEIVSLDDVDWNSMSFYHHFRELGDILRNGDAQNLSEVHATELVNQAKHHLSVLQNAGRWKAALISVLREFLSMATTASVTPFEMELTYSVICASIPSVRIFDRSLEVDDDEARATELPDSLSGVPVDLFILILQLSFSTERALSSAKGRCTVEGYLSAIHMQQDSPVAYLMKRDVERSFEMCILQDLREGNAMRPDFCVAAISTIYNGLGLLQSDMVPPRVYDFAKEIFKLIPVAAPRFIQDRWWFTTKVNTEWVLCKHILNQLDQFAGDNHDHDNVLLRSNPQLLRDLCALGQRVLPNFTVPECSASCTADEHKEWVEKITDFVVSVNLSIVTKFIFLSTEIISGPPHGDWQWMYTKIMYHSGHIYKEIQLRFAESVAKVVSLAPWTWQDQNTSAAYVFNNWLWRYSVDWCWVTDLESAKILAKAIESHVHDRNFKGMIWRESELLDRCHTSHSRRWV
ncbi:hypothetical protein K435DRAFT_756668 [Dendrothele bispora CBS 962.96]|uniref:DUF6535 domain-containing protein n=1 Tax=Dendrothele bispora (strain CBS 962.96) TaxID=1314807 RepID=A0A4S8LYM3_DENBC|nr:hypothetical protein K435DRAFT_756668 [Dendrothele bispora CBS 962.96]